VMNGEEGSCEVPGSTDCHWLFRCPREAFHHPTSSSVWDPSAERKLVSGEGRTQSTEGSLVETHPKTERPRVGDSRSAAERTADSVASRVRFISLGTSYALTALYGSIEGPRDARGDKHLSQSKRRSGESAHDGTAGGSEEVPISPPRNAAAPRDFAPTP